MTPPARTVPPRILVAEDDEEMRRVVIDSLRGDGYDVVAVTDGGELLLRIIPLFKLRPAAEPIDLIVTDARMPVRNGFDIIQALRDDGWARPVVIMIVFADDEARVRAATLNAVLLSKPFEMSALRSHVRELLRVEAEAR